MKIEPKELAKICTSIKFLERAKDAALAYRDLSVPYDRSDLMSAKMWVLGTLDILQAEGFEIVRKSDKP